MFTTHVRCVVVSETQNFYRDRERERERERERGREGERVGDLHDC